MKKILGKIALLLVPILLYYGVFLAFEPNNFFGLRAETPSGAIFGAIRSYQQAPTNSIIVGDSRLAHLDMDTVEDITGRRFSNLAFGGASLKELLDLLEWTLEGNEAIDEVVLGLSYYTLNAAYSTDRFDTIEKALKNPFAYLTSLSYNMMAVENLLLWLDGQPLGGGQDETQDPATYEWVDYTTPTGEVVQLRKGIVAYLADIATYTDHWAPNHTQLDRLLTIIEDCTARGITFFVVLPPMHPALLEYDMKAKDIDTQMMEMLDTLRGSDAVLYDYELTDRHELSEDQYFDGFHLDYQRGLPAFTEELFTRIKEATP